MDTQLIINRIINKVEYAQILLENDKVSNLDSN